MMNPAIKPSLETYTQRGWVRLAFRFDDIALATLSSFDPHVGNGQRLSELDAIHDVLPSAFKTELEIFGYNARPKRAVGFMKTREQNWSLPSHQDRVIVMTERNDDPALTHWTRKSDMWHCEPPPSVLENMAFAYIAFDNVEAGEGGIKIAEGTHRFGKIEQSDIADKVIDTKVSCPALQRGDVLLISALTLHRSSALSQNTARRALRLDFGRVVENKAVSISSSQDD